MKTFAFNQPVTLKTDPTFLGYVWAQVIDESGVEQVMVSVKHPGKTKFHINSNEALPEVDVEPTEDRKTRVSAAWQRSTVD
ncbi:MAG TPA: hypothetical protein VI793_19815 [Anaerolineales bacterium]|nr:hypothetical protein [Anaerolineales bacterium]